MKNALLLTFFVGSIVILTQGCEDKKSEFTPISGGFGVKAQWVGIDSGPKAELYYKTDKSKLVLIWPFLGGEMYYSNDLFIFVALLRDEQGRLGNERYFAAKAPGPAMDISDDLVKLFAESNHLEFAYARTNYVPLQLEKISNKEIQVHFFGPYQKSDTFVVTWQQISDIVQDVKRNGKQHAMEKPHAIYLKKDY